MAKLISRLVNQGFLCVQRRSEVARFEGIILADVRGKNPRFKTTLLAALQLIRDNDARRFARVQRHISWVVNAGLELDNKADYNAGTRTVTVDFIEPEDDAAGVWAVWHYARTIVHEATHGMLISWGIPYSQELRARIEKLCIAEERRFLTRVGRQQPELAEVATIMQREFDPTDWERTWTASRWQRALSALRNVWE